MPGRAGDAKLFQTVVSHASLGEADCYAKLHGASRLPRAERWWLWSGALVGLFQSLVLVLQPQPAKPSAGLEQQLYREPLHCAALG